MRGCLAVRERDSNRLHLLPLAFLPPAAEVTQGDPFGCAFERGHETEHGEQRTEEPDACIKRERRNRDRAAADELENSARAASFFLGKLCDARYIGRLFRHLQTIECRTATSGAFDTADIAREIEQAARALHLHSIARGSHCQHRAGARETSLAHHAAYIAGEFGAEASGLACDLNKRQSGARRRCGAESQISAGSDRDAGGSEAEYQFVGLLAGSEPFSFAQRIADIAEHEEIADSGSRERSHVIGFASDKSAGE